jgi:hypothetical protein
MQVNPLYHHREGPHDVVVVVDTGPIIIPTVSQKWTWIMFCFLLLVDIVTVLVAYLVTGSFDGWFKYFMAGNAICILLLTLIGLIDCIVLSCRKTQR